MVISLFKRHLTSTIFLIIYALWWTLLINWFTTGASVYPNSCGAANGALVLFTLLIVAVYCITLIMMTIFTKGKKRVDYLLFFVLVSLPLLYFILDI